MRLAGVMLLALLLTGCKREPSFDERFDAAQEKIGKAAQAIDAEISASEAAVPDATADATEAAAPM